jgi:tetratricopeptide (TPR) repeat protein
MTKSFLGRVALACAIMLGIVASHAATVELDGADRRKYDEATNLTQGWSGGGDGLQRAFAILMDLARRNPRSAYPLAGLAEIKYRLVPYQQSSIAEVLDLADRAVKLDPENADAQVIYSKATMVQGQIDVAARAAKRAIELAPQKPEAMFQNAKVAEESHRYAEAEKWYRMAIDRLPQKQRKSNTYYHMGVMFKEMNPVEVGKAAEAFGRAAELTDDSIPILNDSASFIMYHTERYDQAIGYLNKALSIGDYSYGRRNLGLAQFFKWGHAAFHPEKYRDAKDKPWEPERITAATGISKEFAFAMNPAVDGTPYATLAMLKRGMIKDVNVFPEDCECPGNALINSANGNHVDLVKMLVEKGANVNATDTKYGSTALLYAVRNQNVEVVRYLLEHGARVNLQDKQGKLLVEYAIVDAKPSDASVLALVLEKGGDADAITREGSPLIAVAVQQGKPAAVELLLRRYKADPNASTRGARSMRVLALAAANSHADGTQMVKTLLQAGANPWVKYGGQDVIDSLKGQQDAFGPGMPPDMAHAIEANITMLEEARRKVARPAGF